MLADLCEEFVTHVLPFPFFVLLISLDFKEGSCNGEIHHNLVEQCRSAGIYANSKQHALGEHPLQAAPLFLCPPKQIDDEADFGLRDDSPARDAGVDTALPQAGGTAKDLGAYEHGVARWQAGTAETPSPEEETMP